MVSYTVVSWDLSDSFAATHGQLVAPIPFHKKTMSQIWNLLLYHPLINLLILLTRLTGNFAWAIILATLILRFALTPLIIPSIKLGKKMQELSPELDKLKAQFKDDKTKLATAQAELYKNRGINPTSGCLPQIIQLLVLIALFNGLNFIIKSNGDLTSRINPILYSFNRLPENYRLSTNFLYLDVTKPDVFRVSGIPFPLPGLILLLSALVQFGSAKMLAPVISEEKKQALKTSNQTDDAMVAAQEQMLYMFPVMTIIFGFQFPSGLIIYWFIFSVVSIFQQYRVIGWGGLKPWLTKFNLVK